MRQVLPRLRGQSLPGRVSVGGWGWSHVPLPSPSCHFHTRALLREGIQGRPPTPHPEPTPSGTNRGQALFTDMPWSGCRPGNRPPAPRRKAALASVLAWSLTHRVTLGKSLLLGGQGERVMGIIASTSSSFKTTTLEKLGSPCEASRVPHAQQEGEGLLLQPVRPGVPSWRPHI